MSLPFTNEVTKSLDFLRQAVAEVHAHDGELADTMTAIVDDLIVNLENQMMLVFANCSIKEREREALLTRPAGSSVPILQFYQQARDGANQSAARGVEHAGAQRTSSGGSGDAAKLQARLADALSLTKPGAAAAAAGGVPAEAEALRAVSTALYVTLEALAHTVKAEQAKLLLAHRSTGSLRVVTSVPDCTAAQRLLFIPAHQGLQGACFSCEVGLRVDAVDPEMRRNYVAPTDEALCQETINSLCFPIMDRVRGCAIGVIECSNKVRGAPWSASDEALMCHAASLLAYVLLSYEVELTAGYTFNPAALHALRPYRPGPYNEGLEALPAAMDFQPKQLVARVRDPSMMPVAVKGKAQQAALDAAVEVERVIDVKEMTTYVRMIDESHARAMHELVVAQEREAELRRELERTSHRARVLEENATYLQEQLQEAKRMITMHTFGHSTDPNYSDFGGSADGAGAAAAPPLPLGSSSASLMTIKSPLGHGGSNAFDGARGGAPPAPQQHLGALLPPIAGGRSSTMTGTVNQPPPPPLRGAKLHDFMSAASTALEQLRAAALANADAAQRARLFSTPQPLKFGTHQQQHSQRRGGAMSALSNGPPGPESAAKRRSASGLR